jgi:quinoprotein glucose dehydrogenase
LSLEERLSEEQTSAIITGGKGMMPAFSQLSKEEHDALLAFLYEKTNFKEPGLNITANPHAPYRISGYTKFLDADGYPAVKPPWGTLNAIDMNTGAYLWKIVYGEYPELISQGQSPTGAESYGGPVVTAGGVLFIAGTKDGKFRIYDSSNGALLWETRLPAASFATPATYEVNGRQYIVLACGGTKLGAEKGDSYIAFALPENP